MYKSFRVGHPSFHELVLSLHKAHVPLLQPQFPLPAEQQHKLDHGGFESRKVVGEEKDGGWYGGR